MTGGDIYLFIFIYLFINVLHHTSNSTQINVIFQDSPWEARAFQAKTLIVQMMINNFTISLAVRSYS